MKSEKLISIVTNEKKRAKAQYTVVFLILGIVSLFMTVLNIITAKGALTWATAIFTVLCLLNLFITVRSKTGRGMAVASVLFMIEIIVLFTFFIISGNPDGFSVIWIAMLPSCGMLLFGLKRSAVVCGTTFALLIFFFWTPFGRQFLQYGYNETFMMRFPILCVAFFAVSALLELIRVLTQKELDKLRENYKYLSTHDYLTSLYNRQGLNEAADGIKPEGSHTVFMLDIDHFKVVNDIYGHSVGDSVLKETAKAMSEAAPEAIACRWGGEEFLLWFPNGGGDPEAVRAKVNGASVVTPDGKTVRVTISVGAASDECGLDELIRRADKALYRAKANGRDRVELDGGSTL